MPNAPIHRLRSKSLGVPELIAIALGGMVGGGIFTILGIAVSLIGPYTPVAIVLGGLFAALAAYSYVKLGVYFKDEGATYSFIKKSFPNGAKIASLVGWWVIFGYISTLALYAYTFASYAISGTEWADSEIARKAVAGAVIAVFTIVNVWSVRGMGRLEDLMVYTKLLILVVISVVLATAGETSIPTLIRQHDGFDMLNILIVASVTFVAYEGFQLVINASGEMDRPERNIPRAIYIAIALAILVYVVIATGALMAIPFEDIIANQEYALAAGAADVLGPAGSILVVFGALLATSSAISGTVFGASRQMAVIARDGFMPGFLATRRRSIPVNAIITMSACAFALVLAGNLRVILEFGSVTFLLVSFVMAFTNLKMRRQTGSSLLMTLVAMLGLALGTVLIIYFEATTQPEQLVFIGGLYLLLSTAAWAYSSILRGRSVSSYKSKKSN
ncbi:APC family permease [Hyphobacterium sp.]|uniref:APC family permease n=1 Tax=Hyphobacterium sp. TaxID=2004662 RepID=UPI003B524AB6